MGRYYNDFLEHHGIHGQRWGDRNGPPYPLGTKQHSAVIKRKKWGAQKITAKKYELAKKKTTAEDRQTIKEINEWNKKGKYSLKTTVANTKVMLQKLGRLNDDVDAKRQLPLKKKQLSMEEDARRVNPGHGKTTDVRQGNNCELCSIAYDMRRRGYDVMARQKAPVSLLYQLNNDDISVVYPKAKTTAIHSYKDMNKQPEGSRGTFQMRWGDPKKNPTVGGHVVAYEVHNGQCTFLDTQNNEIFTDPYKHYAKDGLTPRNFQYTRLDNTEPNYKVVRVAIE